MAGPADGYTTRVAEPLEAFGEDREHRPPLDSVGPRKARATAYSAIRNLHDLMALAAFFCCIWIGIFGSSLSTASREGRTSRSLAPQTMQASLVLLSGPPSSPRTAAPTRPHPVAALLRAAPADPGDAGRCQLSRLLHRLAVLHLAREEGLGLRQHRLGEVDGLRLDRRRGDRPGDGQLFAVPSCQDRDPFSRCPGARSRSGWGPPSSPTCRTWLQAARRSRRCDPGPGHRELRFDLPRDLQVLS
jgi:hypothetical protein